MDERTTLIIKLSALADNLSPQQLAALKAAFLFAEHDPPHIQ